MSAPATVPAVLRAAADLIEQPGKWVQKACAVDRRGVETDPCGPDAARFCAYGAIQKVAGYADREEPQRALQAHATQEIGTSAVSIWQDDPKRTQAEVVALLRGAAALAEAEPPARLASADEDKPGMSQ